MSDATAAPAPAAAVVTLDAEDQMAVELAALRQERASEGTAAAAPSPAPAPAPGDAADATAAGPAPDTTTPPAASTTQAPAAAGPAPAAAPADPAELLRQTQQQLQQARSELGRVGQLNRLLNETRAERDRLSGEVATLKKAAPTPEQQLGEDAAARLAAIAEKAKGFPELEGLVSAVQDALKASHAQVEAAARQTVETGLAPLQTMRAEQAQREQESRAAAHEAAMQTFQSTYPTAVEVVRSQEFQEWIRVQAKPIQAAFFQGQEPGEAVAVMDAYDAHLRRTGKAPIAVYPQQAASTPAPPAQQQQQAAAQRSSANAARLQSAAGLPSRGSGNKGGMPPEDDFEASVEYFRNLRLAKQRAV